MSAIDFLKTKRTKDELATALAVIEEFKQCESDEEWQARPFVSWAMLELLQEYLRHLALGEPLNADTIAAIAATSPERTT